LIDVALTRNSLVALQEALFLVEPLEHKVVSRDFVYNVINEIDKNEIERSPTVLQSFPCRYNIGDSQWTAHVPREGPVRTH
jgi:hypothetical protein